MSTSKILMLYTGGTIGMVKDPETGGLLTFNFEHLLEQIPEIAQMDCDIDTDSLDHPIDSSDMKPEHWIRLAKRVYDGYAHYDGFVILHGSDTMAYSASALSFLLQNLSKPVIFTGSQLPIGITRSDARENLLTALEIALTRRQDNLAMIPEVAVYFEYDLFRGNRIHKISTEDFEAFQSLNYPKLAEAGVHIKFNEAYIDSPAKDSLIIYDKMISDIGVLTVFPGMMPDFVRSVVENTNLRGLVIRSFGSGNAPTDPWFLKMVHEAIDRGVKVVNISQCDGGGVIQGKYEASRHLRDMGVISGGNMTFEAGLTKMMFLLANFPHEKFAELYQTNLRGELSN